MIRLLAAVLCACASCLIVAAPELTGLDRVLLVGTFTAAVVSLHHLFTYPPRALTRRFARATQ